MNGTPELSAKERLLMQQLRLADWASRRATDEAPVGDTSDADSPSLPATWQLTRGWSLAAWQVAARKAWFAAGGSGTIKVVTGAGKTVVALAIAERLQSDDQALRVAVVVPTIVLMEQWVQVLHEHSNLPAAAIGRLGGGHTDDFAGPRRILVAVLASARKELPALVREAGIGENLLLIADECHRTGAPEMSAVLHTQRRYSLGLSATPDRDDDGGAGDASGVGQTQSLGRIVYELSFADAIRLSVLPPFDIYHYGLSLSEEEVRRYDALTRSISDVRRELMAISPTARSVGGGDGLVAWARRVSSRGSTAGPEPTYYLAGEYDMPLRFEFEGHVLSGEGCGLDGRPLEPGDLWEGPHPGIPYVLAAGKLDIYYETSPRPDVIKRVKLSVAVGHEAAATIAGRIRRVKGWAGGRFYVNEWKEIFAPINLSTGLEYRYIGHLDEDAVWFPKVVESSDVGLRHDQVGRTKGESAGV